MITITLEETLIDHTKDQTITLVTLDQNNSSYSSSRSSSRSSGFSSRSSNGVF